MSEIRVLIADDEPPARRKLQRLLAAHADIAVKGEASTGIEAVGLLREHRPDAIFLDVQMPGLDGFEVLEALEDLKETAVIFVTAFEEYAVKAFEVQALDYLLKPVTSERLAVVLERLRSQRGRGESSHGMGERYWRRILVRGARSAHFITPADIDWIEADRNYVALHCSDREHLLRTTLDAFLQRLDPMKFARINRSTVVTLDQVVELQPSTHGEYRLFLKSGRELTWSRRYVSSTLERFLPRSSS